MQHVAAEAEATTAGDLGARGGGSSLSGLLLPLRAASVAVAWRGATTTVRGRLVGSAAARRGTTHRGLHLGEELVKRK